MVMDAAEIVCSMSSSRQGERELNNLLALSSTLDQLHFIQIFSS